MWTHWNGEASTIIGFQSRNWSRSVEGCTRGLHLTCCPAHQFNKSRKRVCCKRSSWLTPPGALKPTLLRSSIRLILAACCLSDPRSSDSVISNSGRTVEFKGLFKPDPGVSLHPKNWVYSTSYASTIGLFLSGKQKPGYFPGQISPGGHRFLRFQIGFLQEHRTKSCTRRK